MAALAFSLAEARAAMIPVPNFSFESPSLRDYGNPIALPYDFAPILPWQATQTTSFQIGVFPNQPITAPDYIDNVEGQQVAFMFAGAGISLFQDLSTPDATFEIGKAYRLTIAAGGNDGLPDDAHIQLRLYYRDAGNKVTVAVASFLFDPKLDPYPINHLFDYTVETPLVQVGDAWAGKAIGIEIATPSGPGGSGAYWDVDNVRLASVPEPSGAALLIFGATMLGRRRRRSP